MCHEGYFVRDDFEFDSDQKVAWSLLQWTVMSALGQKRTLGHVRIMSALPPKADIGTQPRNVRFVPKADIHRLKIARASKRTNPPRA
jgi:hypothetical protein